MDFFGALYWMAEVRAITPSHQPIRRRVREDAIQDGVEPDVLLGGEVLVEAGPLEDDPHLPAHGARPEFSSGLNFASDSSERFSYPAQESSGNLGYFGNRGSTAESLQRKNTDPRSELIRRTCLQLVQSPTDATAETSSITPS